MAASAVDLDHFYAWGTLIRKSFCIKDAERTNITMIRVNSLIVRGERHLLKIKIDRRLCNIHSGIWILESMIETTS